MKSTVELKIYKSAINASYGECQLLTAKDSAEVANANNTSSRNAPRGFSWIDYWCAMTGTYRNPLYCSCCGKSIYAGDVPLIMKSAFLSMGETLEMHKAYGGHVWVTEPQGASYKGGRYITPLCPECNSKRGDKLVLRRGCLLCKEITV